MTDAVQIARIGRRAIGRATPEREPARLPVKVDLPGAKVFLLQGRYRHADYIARHVAYVLSRPADVGEAHVLRNLLAIRRSLLEIGVSEKQADAELQIIHSRVRAEMWRQVLLPEADQ